MRWTARIALALSVCGGAYAAGAALAPAQASPDLPLAGPFNDQDLVFTFRNRKASWHALKGGIHVTGGETGAARGNFVRGTLLRYQRSDQVVTIDPGVLKDHLEVVRGFDALKADRVAERMIGRVERSGNTRLFEAVERELRSTYESTRFNGLGMLIRDEDHDGRFPPSDDGTNDQSPAQRRLRDKLCGDDDVWRAHLAGDLTAFPTLVEGAADRFRPAPGALPDANGHRPSVFEMREHRRVLVRRGARTVTFLAEVPERDDLSDAAFLPGATSEIGYVPVVSNGLRKVSDAFGRKLSAARPGFGFVLPAEPRFIQTECVTSVQDKSPASQLRPVVLDVTPPDGETDVDPTIDWESPDDVFTTPMAQRARFRVRMRFQHPLDPRRIDPTTFRITLVTRNVGTDQEVAVFEPVTLESVALRQSRLGDVTVEITPEHTLDLGAEYSARALGIVRGLNGELLSVDYKIRFRTAR